MRDRDKVTEDPVKTRHKSTVESVALISQITNNGRESRVETNHEQEIIHVYKEKPHKRSKI